MTNKASTPSSTKRKSAPANSTVTPSSPKRRSAAKTKAKATSTPARRGRGTGQKKRSRSVEPGVEDDEDEHVKEDQEEEAEHSDVIEGESFEEEELIGSKSSASRKLLEKKEKFVYIHVRHFTKRVYGKPTVLEAIVWFEDGTHAGPYALDERARTKDDQRMHKPMKRNEISGMTDIPFPLRKNVAFLQLRNAASWWEKTLGIEEDIFIQDAFLKPNKKKSPSKNTLAYFRFTGFLVHKTNILLKNVLFTEYNLTVGEVRNDPINEDRRIQDRLLPVLEWANESKTEAFAYMLRTVFDAVGLGYGKTLQRILLDTVTLRNTPLVANLFLSFGLDIKRYAGTPGFVRLPPGDFTFSVKKFDEFIFKNTEPIPYAQEYVQAGADEGRRMAEVDFTQFLKDHFDRTTQREIDEVERVWAYTGLDEEFGRQLTEGLFCTQIHVVPEKVNDRSEWLQDLIEKTGRDKTKTKLFYMDYTCLIGVPRNEGTPPNRAEQEGFFNPARCLLEYRQDKKHKTKGKLFPIAISLFYCREYYPTLDALGPERKPFFESREQKLERRLRDGIWLNHFPHDETWEVAKIFCKSAASQHHQVVAHALYTHLVIEPFAVALERVVPLDHILYRLLKTHFRYTLDVNFKARTTLISKGGVFDQFISTGGMEVGHLKFMAKNFKEWSMDKMILPKELASRGFLKNPHAPDCELPEYMYAIDAMTIWKAMEEYISGVILNTYRTDKDVQSDSVLRNFFMEVQTNGFPDSPSFFPESRHELVQILTGVIFTATAQHAAVNFPQFSHYGYARNSPLSLAKKAPLPGGNGNVGAYLPNDEQARKAISIVWGLSRFVPDDERFIYDPIADDAPKKAIGSGNAAKDLAPRHRHFFNLSLSNDEDFREHCLAFQEAMRHLEEEILTRPTSAYGTKYRWLLPSKIPTSIAT